MNTIETANAHVDKVLKDNGLLIRGAKMMMVRKLMADSYLAGASAMNGSAGVPAARKKKMRDEAVNLFELIKGFTTETNDNAMKAAIEFAGYVLELTNDESVSSPLPQINATGMWVKAKDRLPKPDEEVKIRLNGREYLPLRFIRRMSTQWQVEGFEWFDEGVSSPSPLEAETADKDRILELEAEVKALKTKIDNLNSPNYGQSSLLSSK